MVGAACLATLSSAARAQVVQTFEDFVPCDDVMPNVGVYGSVNYLLQWTCFSFPQAPFNAHSGANRVFASNGADNSTSASFTFGATQFTGAWFAGNANISFLMFLGANQVATSGTLSANGTPAFLSSGYSGLVDRVTVSANNVNWVMDDVSFAGVTTTPEPESIALVASALAMIAGGVGVRRRSKRQR